MVRIAITGGIACGKSLLAACLAERGVQVCEADELAHAVLARGQPVHAAVVAEFGGGILERSGEIDRQALGREVFDDERKRARLNALTHPEIMRRLNAWLARMAREGSGVAAVIPLLYEIGGEGRWGRVVCVAAPERLQIERLAARGLSPVEARRRIAAQLPLVEKMARADHVIFNCASQDLLRAQADRMWERIQGD
jgi:dephospho-CoA kinase